MVEVVCPHQPLIIYFICQKLQHTLQLYFVFYSNLVNLVRRYHTDGSMWGLPPLIPIVALRLYSVVSLIISYPVLVNFRLFFVNHSYLVMIPLHPAPLQILLWIYPLNLSWTSILYCSLKNYMSIPRNQWFPHLDTVISPKFSAIALNIPGFIC